MGLQEMPTGRESIRPPAVVFTVTRETGSRFPSGMSNVLISLSSVSSYIIPSLYIS